MWVLDTNTVAYWYRGDGNVGERCKNTPRSRVALPAVVVYEIEVGLRRRPEALRRRTWFDALVGAVRVLPFDAAAARASAEIRAQLEASGHPIGPLDTLIAGTTLAVGGTLVTRNRREFDRVPGLRVEDWY